MIECWSYNEGCMSVWLWHLPRPHPWWKCSPADVQTNTRAVISMPCHITTEQEVLVVFYNLPWMSSSDDSLEAHCCLASPAQQNPEWWPYSPAGCWLCWCTPLPAQDHHPPDRGGQSWGRFPAYSQHCTAWRTHKHDDSGNNNSSCIAEKELQLIRIMYTSELNVCLLHACSSYIMICNQTRMEMLKVNIPEYHNTCSSSKLSSNSACTHFCPVSRGIPVRTAAASLQELSLSYMSARCCLMLATCSSKLMTRGWTWRYSNEWGFFWMCEEKPQCQKHKIIQ